MAASNFDWDDRANAAKRPRDDFTSIEFEGVRAYKAGKGRNDCPLPFGSSDQQQWDCGFDNAHFADHGPDDFTRPGDRRANTAKNAKAKSYQFRRGDIVCKRVDADTNPDNVVVYTLIEQRRDIGDKHWLCAATVGGGLVFLAEDELYPAEWIQKTKGGNQSSKTPNWTRPNANRRPADRRKAAAQTAKTIPIHTPDRPRINAAGRFLTFTVMGTFTVLSQQVWMHYSDTLLRQINRIPFLGLIVQAPMVGGVIEFFGPWFPDLFGVGVWALINACQSGKDIIKLLDIRDPWWVAMLTDWSRPQYVAAAYIAEITLNYDKFPLFKGGIDYLIANRDSLDMDLFLWPNVFYLLISVLSFEHLVKFFTPKSVRGKRGTTRNPQSI